jgi:hypothetical protein
MGKFSDYEYRKQPGFDMNTFEGAYQAIPMKHRDQSLPCAGILSPRQGASL